MIRFNHHIQQKKPTNLFSIYTFTLSLIFLADATLAYIFPVLVEREVKSQIILGVIMSFSSIVGLLCDLFFPQILRKMRWASILLLGSLLSLGFTFFVHFSVYTLPIIFALFAVSFWGIYYELVIFSQEKFIVEETPQKYFTRSWSIISSIIFFTWIVSPILAAKLLLQDQSSITTVILIIQIMTIICSVFLFSRSVKAHKTLPAKHKLNNVSLAVTLKKWKKYLPYLFGTILIIFLVRVLESAYWMFGALFAETLDDLSKGEEFLILLVYTIPLAIGSLFSAYLNINKNKKIISILLTFIAGLTTFLGIYMSESFVEMAIPLFIANMLFAFVLSLASSQNSDFQEKLTVEERFFAVGLISFSGSLAYILGPLVLGFISEYYGYRNAFASVGFFISLISIVLIINHLFRFKNIRNVV